MTTWDKIQIALLVAIVLPFYVYVLSKAGTAGKMAAYRAFFRDWKHSHSTEEATDGKKEEK